VTNIDFTETQDNSSSWNGTQFVSPESAEYLIDGVAGFTSSLSRAIGAYVDTGSGATLLKRISGTTSASNHSFNGSVFLNKGDILTLRSNENGGTLSNNSAIHTITITKKGNSQQISEAVEIDAYYTSDSGQTMSSASQTTVIYEDLTRDSHAAYDTGSGEYTMPRNALCSIAIGIGTQWNYTASQQMRLVLEIDDVDFIVEFYEAIATKTSVAVTPKISVAGLYLEEGQTIKASVLNGTGSNQNLLGSSLYEYFSIRCK
jgi:hypothetical protein